MKQKGRVFHRKKDQAVNLEVKDQEEPVVKETKPEQKKKVVKAQKKPVPPTILETEPSPPILLEGVTIFDLKMDSCRFILGPVQGVHTMYCGKETDGRSFCEDHKKLCYIYAKPASAKSAHPAIDA